jgi:hypothetical protein
MYITGMECDGRIENKEPSGLCINNSIVSRFECGRYMYIVSSSIQIIYNIFPGYCFSIGLFVFYSSVTLFFNRALCFLLYTCTYRIQSEKRSNYLYKARKQENVIVNRRDITRSILRVYPCTWKKKNMLFNLVCST